MTGPHRDFEAPLIVEFPPHPGAKTRRGEPVSCAVPFGRGVISEPRVTLLDRESRPVTVQTLVTDRWSDGSIRWLLLDWQADGMPGTNSHYRLVPGEARRDSSLAVESAAASTVVRTGAATFVLRNDAFPFASVLDANERPIIDPTRSTLQCHDATGTNHRIRLHDISVERSGPCHAVVVAHGELGRGELELCCWMHFYASSPVVGLDLMLRNPRRAQHPGGIWTLGDRGSILLREIALIFQLADELPTQRFVSPEAGASLTVPTDTAIELYQDSSGGERWDGSIHVNRDGRVPHSFRGYRIRHGNAESFGLRATPTACVRSAAGEIAIAVEEFWQNFPKSIELTGTRIAIGLFPRQSVDCHELQGGEQKTHTVSVAFGPDPTGCSLDWVRCPAIARCTPEWYASSDAIPYLTPVATDSNRGYVGLCNAAIEGTDTFETKREAIDEYGWRNFGDIYGDHEAIHEPGRLVSHYNNQYDPIAGFAYQFMRSGDVRWWRQMLQLARHVVDIDIYHTNRDRQAYNHGLFWHTAHYIDAGTSTHRSYPRAAGVLGGGPASDHNYTTGLMLHYFMTASSLSRAAVIDLATFVIDREHPSATRFGWLDRGDTGLATLSQNGYYGPGRASGNSVNALLDGHRLTSDARFLDQADRLIRRCVHPTEDLARHDLLDAERRWFYTMMLEAMGKYP